MRSNQHQSPLASASSCDVIVVGGGAAGAATAMLLARSDLRILLLDHPSPSDHDLNGPALLRGGVLQLSRWGLLDDVVAAATPPVRQMTFRHGDEELMMSIKPSHGVDALYAPHRSVLHPLLLNAAVDAGADVRYDVTVTDVIVRRGRVVGVSATTSDRRAVDISAALVIGADGARSTVAQLVGSTYSRVGTSAGAITYGYWPDATPDRYAWTFRPDSCSGVFPTNGGAAWVFATGRVLEGTPASTMRTRRDRRGYIRRAWGPGWALVGDAGYFEDPILAHGLSSALRDAELLARAVTAGFGQDSTLDDALAHYERTRNRLGVPLFEVVDRIASQQWDDAEIARLLLQLGSAMAHEVEALVALEPGATP
jgi:2-polyprenyl-6-methoxyphenol hydroxylase-like FAD-dependent oxidoreductase